MQKIPRISFQKKQNAQLEFEIVTLQSLFRRQTELSFALDKPHRVDFYSIMYITRGTGIHEIDFVPYVYRAGSVLFISQGQVHAFDAGPGRDGYLLLFTEHFLAKNLIHSDLLSLYRLYNYHLHVPILQPEELGREDFRGLVSELYREYRAEENFAREDLLRLWLKLLLLKAERIKRTLIADQKNAGWPTLFGAFRNHLERSFSETRNAADYAGRLNISYNHLNRICKSMAGATAKEFIDRFVVLEIKRRLAMADISVKELTYAMGFDEPTNLVKYFKKHTGQSPTQFKHSLQSVPQRPQ